MVKNIPVSEPVFDNNEIDNVTGALLRKEISGLFGGFIGRFEREFSAFVGCRHGVSVSNGTVAIHLALLALGIKPGDEVLVSSYTNMATFFPVLYISATPIPIDVEPDTFNIDPEKIERHITTHTRAIIVVHIFGHPVDMDPVMDLARRYRLPVIEDCAEAHGALYKGNPVGSIGKIGCFSFYANKIITTGEGGMITTNDEDIALHIASLKSLAFGASDKFMHQETGYNYRMTNLQAAIGCAQLDKVGLLIDGKRRLAEKYNHLLRGRSDLQLPVEKPYAKNVYWMYHIVLTDHARKSRNQVMLELRSYGIETRQGFTPYNMQQYYIDLGMTSPELCPVANNLARNAFYLPSTPTLTDDDIEYVADRLLYALDH